LFILERKKGRRCPGLEGRRTERGNLLSSVWYQKRLQEQGPDTGKNIVKDRVRKKDQEGHKVARPDGVMYFSGG